MNVGRTQTFGPQQLLFLFLSNLVCVAVWKNHHMRTVTNYFIVNLSLADVLVTITCLPATLVVDITETWFFGQSLCKVIPYLQVIVFDILWGSNTEATEKAFSCIVTVLS